MKNSDPKPGEVSLEDAKAKGKRIRHARKGQVACK
jgi:hypothetical protein